MRRTVLVLSLSALALTGCHRSSSGAKSVRPLGFVGFETRLELSLPAAPVAALAVVDFDSDGRCDLAAVDRDGNLAFAMGVGGGAFAAGHSHRLHRGPVALEVGDLDGDGTADLLSLAGDAGTIDVLFNGAGADARQAALHVGAGAVDFVLEDVDGDGALDVVVAHLGRSDLLWFGGIGDGAFRSPVSLPMTRSARVTGLLAGDFDGDGSVDLAVCDTEDDRVRLLLGTPGGLPSRQVDVPVGATPFALAAGDVTGDGRPDLVVSNVAGGTIDVIEHRPSGAFVVTRTIDLDGQPGQAVIGDATGDGIDDLVVCVIDHRAVALFEGGAAGVADQGLQLPATGSPIQPSILDVDGDGVMDLCVAGWGSAVANVWFGRDGGLRGGRLHRIDGLDSPDLTAAADFDLDGRAEVAVAGFRSSVVTILKSRADAAGHPVFEPVQRFDFGRLVQNLFPVDVDRDGRTDLVAALDGGVRILANRQVGLVTILELIPSDPGALLAPGKGPFELHVADVDGDGALDFVVAYHADNQVALLRGSRSERFGFEPVQITPLDGRPVGIATGDFDGDGRPEVAVSRIGKAVVTVLEVTPDGLVPSFDTQVGAGPNYLRTADFDLNGRMDLVVSNGESDSITMLLADAGGFRRIDVPAGDAPTALLTRDLNRDGRPDILVASLVGSDFRVLLGDGRGGLGQSLVFPGVHSAFSAAFADLDGDGLEDLLIGSLFCERLATFRNISRIGQ